MAYLLYPYISKGNFLNIYIYLFICIYLARVFSEKSLKNIKYFCQTSDFFLGVFGARNRVIERARQPQPMPNR